MDRWQAPVSIALSSARAALIGVRPVRQVRLSVSALCRVQMEEGGFPGRGLTLYLVPCAPHRAAICRPN